MHEVMKMELEVAKELSEFGLNQHKIAITRLEQLLSDTHEERDIKFIGEWISKHKESTAREESQLQVMNLISRIMPKDDEHGKD